MTTKWKFRDGKWRRINVEFEEQFQKTKLLSATIRSIYDKDSTLTPQEQHDAIEALAGMSISDMQSVIEQNGTQLAETIRAIISKDRALE